MFGELAVEAGRKGLVKQELLNYIYARIEEYKYTVWAGINVRLRYNFSYILFCLLDIHFY